jgi:hypothetical protein
MKNLKKPVGKSVSYKKIFGIILLLISIIWIIIFGLYILSFFMAFDITVNDPLGYRLIFSWLIEQLIPVIFGIFGIFYSIKIIRRNK